MLTEAISPTVIRENRWEVFTTALMGKGFMPSNHCFHYNYICTLIKRAHHNANNTPDVLYIIYIKANQCWFCVQSMEHVCTTYRSLSFVPGDMYNHLLVVFYSQNTMMTLWLLLDFVKDFYYSNHISGIFFLKYIFADTLSNILIAFLGLRAEMLCAQWRVTDFFHEGAPVQFDGGVSQSLIVTSTPPPIHTKNLSSLTVSVGSYYNFVHWM